MPISTCLISKCSPLTALWHWGSVISFTNGLGLYVLRVLTAIGLFMVGLLFKYLILTVTL